MSVRTTVCSKSCCAALLPPKGPHKGQPMLGDHLAPGAAVGELSRPRPVRAGRRPAGARRDAGHGGAERGADAVRGLARRSRRDRLYRPLRQCDDRDARRDRCRDGKPRLRRPDDRAGPDVLGRAARCGILVRQFERARRNRRQRRPGRPADRALRSAARSRSHRPERPSATYAGVCEARNGSTAWLNSRGLTCVKA